MENLTLEKIIKRSINSLITEEDHSLSVRFNEENSNYELSVFFDNSIRYLGAINLMGSGYFDATGTCLDYKTISLIEEHLYEITKLAKSTSDRETRIDIIKEYFINNLIN